MNIGEILEPIDWESVGGAATALALLVALVTYVTTARREKSIRRAELVRAYTADFYSDERVVKLFMDLDYERFEFPKVNDQWLGTIGEATLVRMLDLFNSIGHNYARKVLTIEDIHGTTLGYAILRAHGSLEVRKYLEHVRAWDGENLGTGVPFQYFQQLGNDLLTRSRRARERNRAVPAIIATTHPMEPLPPPRGEPEEAPTSSSRSEGSADDDSRRA
ncbi:hypothetical protein [Georgenia sp. H159]|uniref:hypothetical protein n=1 Tax=Georgenia sp. H159 TaxID=3076115 RepID=UPI002D766486|nr:hypothetical protein [Georgenia sp. H159]